MKNNSRLGFSLLEVSVVLLIIGILLASVTAGKSMIRSSRITSAQSLTSGSPVSAVEGLALWLETVLAESIKEDDTYQSEPLDDWKNITNYYTGSRLAIVGGSNPSYVESGINDLPSIAFDGDDAVNINSPLRHIVGNNFSIFIVEENGGDGGTDILIGNDNDKLLIQYSGTNFQIEKNNSQVVNQPITITPAINYISFATASNRSAPAGTAYYRNRGVKDDGETITADNTDANIDTISSLPAMSNATLGATTDGYGGNISEVIIYDRNLTFTELNEVLNYLSSKYRISLNKS